MSKSETTTAEATENRQQSTIPAPTETAPTPTCVRCETCTWRSRRFLSSREADDRARLHRREHPNHRMTTSEGSA